MPTSPDQDETQEFIRQIAREGGPLGFDPASDDFATWKLEEIVEGRDRTWKVDDVTFHSKGQIFHLRNTRSGVTKTLPVRIQEGVPVVSIDDLADLDLGDEEEIKRALRRSRKKIRLEPFPEE